MIPAVLVVLLIIVLSTNGGSSDSVAPVAAVPAGPAHAITAREWQLIAKDPDGHKGESVIVYGRVTQFDSATGGSGFLADVDGVAHPVEGGFVSFPTNTMLSGDGAALKDLVEQDVFKASVTVAGSQSYDTQIGGHTTVPALSVQSIAVTGHAG